MARQTNGMPVFLGRGVGLDSDDMIPNLSWKPKVYAKTAAFTVLQSQSGAIFTTEGATAAVTFTLPTAASGPWVFEFYSAEDVAMTITAETADTMVALNDLAADSIAFSTTSLIIGGSAKVFSAGGSVVYAQILSDGATVTVAT